MTWFIIRLIISLKLITRKKNGLKEIWWARRIADKWCIFCSSIYFLFNWASQRLLITEERYCSYVKWAFPFLWTSYCWKAPVKRLKIKIKNLWLQNLLYLKKNNGMYKTIELKGSISVVIMFLIKWLNELRGESEI